MSNCKAVYFENMPGNPYRYQILLQTDGLYHYLWLDVEAPTQLIAEHAKEKAFKHKRAYDLFHKFEKMLGEPKKIKDLKNWYAEDTTADCVEPAKENHCSKCSSLMTSTDKLCLTCAEVKSLEEVVKRLGIPFSLKTLLIAEENIDYTILDGMEKP